MQPQNWWLLNQRFGDQCLKVRRSESFKFPYATFPRSSHLFGVVYVKSFSRPKKYRNPYNNGVTLFSTTCFTSILGITKPSYYRVDGPCYTVLAINERQKTNVLRSAVRVPAIRNPWQQVTAEATGTYLLASDSPPYRSLGKDWFISSCTLPC